MEPAPTHLAEAPPETTTGTEHHNPFEVLELDATASARDITRQKDKLLGMLELGLQRAKKYTSSRGDKERTADLVRSAAQELERPRSRLTWELWLEPSERDIEGDEDAAFMRRALILHRQLLKETTNGTPFGVEELDELGTAWDDALGSDYLYNRVVDRASELELEIDEDEVLDEFRDEIREQLRTMLEQGPPLDLDALSSEIASDVAHEFTDRKVELLEIACSQIATKQNQHTQRLRQWHGLVREYANAVTDRGEHFRRTAFQSVSSSLSDIAVELFNSDVDHQTALSMFKWLRDEAHNLGDDELTTLHAKNVTIVADRIANDEAAVHSAYYDSSSGTSSSSTGWDALRAIFWCVGIILVLARAGDGCKSSTPTFQPPKIEIPRFQYQHNPELYRDLQNLREMRELRRQEQE